MDAERAMHYLFEEHFFIDLRQEPVERIMQDQKPGLAELLLKHGKLRDFFNFLQENNLFALQQVQVPYLEEALIYTLALDENEGATNRCEVKRNSRRSKELKRPLLRSKRCGKERNIKPQHKC